MTNGSEEGNKGLTFDQELIELENCCRRKRRMAQRKEFSNSLILDKKKICEICVTKESSAGDNSQIHCEAKILIIAEKFSNSQILDKKENLWNLCDKKKGEDYEEAKDHRAGGEGSSSRAHGIPDGDRNHELYGKRTVLKIED